MLNWSLLCRQKAAMRKRFASVQGGEWPKRRLISPPTSSDSLNASDFLSGIDVSRQLAPALQAVVGQGAAAHPMPAPAVAPTGEPPDLGGGTPFASVAAHPGAGSDLPASLTLPYVQSVSSGFSDTETLNEADMPETADTIDMDLPSSVGTGWQELKQPLFLTTCAAVFGRSSDSEDPGVGSDAPVDPEMSAFDNVSWTEQHVRDILPLYKHHLRILRAETSVMAAVFEALEVLLRQSAKPKDSIVRHAAEELCRILNLGRQCYDGGDALWRPESLKLQLLHTSQAVLPSGSINLSLEEDDDWDLCVSDEDEVAVPSSSSPQASSSMPDCSTRPPQFIQSSCDVLRLLLPEQLRGSWRSSTSTSEELPHPIIDPGCIRALSHFAHPAHILHDILSAWNRLPEEECPNTAASVALTKGRLLQMITSCAEQTGEEVLKQNAALNAAAGDDVSDFAQKLLATTSTNHSVSLASLCSGGSPFVDDVPDTVRAAVLARTWLACPAVSDCSMDLVMRGLCGILCSQQPSLTASAVLTCAHMHSALSTGTTPVLVGPPNTGKSHCAQLLAELLTPAQPRGALLDALGAGAPEQLRTGGHALQWRMTGRARTDCLQDLFRASGSASAVSASIKRHVDARFATTAVVSPAVLLGRATSCCVCPGFSYVVDEAQHFLWPALSLGRRDQAAAAQARLMQASDFMHAVVVPQPGMALLMTANAEGTLYDVLSEARPRDVSHRRSLTDSSVSTTDIAVSIVATAAQLISSKFSTASVLNEPGQSRLHNLAFMGLLQAYDATTSSASAAMERVRIVQHVAITVAEILRTHRKLRCHTIGVQQPARSDIEEALRGLAFLFDIESIAADVVNQPRKRPSARRGESSQALSLLASTTASQIVMAAVQSMSRAYVASAGHTPSPFQDPTESIKGPVIAALPRLDLEQYWGDIVTDDYSRQRFGIFNGMIMQAPTSVIVVRSLEPPYFVAPESCLPPSEIEDSPASQWSVGTVYDTAGAHLTLPASVRHHLIKCLRRRAPLDLNQAVLLRPYERCMALVFEEVEGVLLAVPCPNAATRKHVDSCTKTSRLGCTFLPPESTPQEGSFFHTVREFGTEAVPLPLCAEHTASYRHSGSFTVPQLVLGSLPMDATLLAATVNKLLQCAKRARLPRIGAPVSIDMIAGQPQGTQAAAALAAAHSVNWTADQVPHEALWHLLLLVSPLHSLLHEFLCRQAVEDFAATSELLPPATSVFSLPVSFGNFNASSEAAATNYSRYLLSLRADWHMRNDAAMLQKNVL